MNKITLSIAVTVLTLATAFSGCGDSTTEVPAGTETSSSLGFNNSVGIGGNSSSFSFISSTGSINNGITRVLVSDAYVLNADVTINGTKANINAGGGVYEWTSAMNGTIVASNGVNDLNGNSGVDVNDAYAPQLSAPAGYANVNPFTTLLVQGASNSVMFSNYPNAFNVGSSFDFDVVAEGNKNIEVAKEVLKAALSLATAQKAPSFRAGDNCVKVPILPSNIDPNETNYCDANTPVSSSSISSSSSDGSSSSSDGSSSSDASNSSMNSTSSEGSSTITGISAQVIQQIDTATSRSTLNSIAKTQFDDIFGPVVP